jgi:hypothetical protein
VAELHADEAPLSQPFWIFENLAEQRVVTSVLARRFPAVFAALSEGLESADPLDIVYPGNPAEYSDVVLEVLVLMAARNEEDGVLSSSAVERLLREGLARRFGEAPDETRVRAAARMIAERLAS